MKQVRKWLPLGGALLLVYLLLRQIDPGDVVDLLLNIDVRWFFMGVFWYGLTNVLRAYRFGALLQYEGWRRPLTILPEMFAMNFLNNVLPARSGELSFPYFMVRRHGVSVGESATVLVLARVFDYLAVACLFVIFALYELPNLTPVASRVVTAVIGLLLLSAMGLLLAPWLAGLFFGFLPRLFPSLYRPERRIGVILTKAEAQIGPTLRRLRSVPIYAWTLLWSIGVWLAMFACFTAFLSAVRLPQQYSIVIVGSTFATLAKALPLMTIGGFGVHEAGWALGFSLTGMETGLAITSGFAVNILILLTSSCLGGAALLWINRAKWPLLGREPAMAQSGFHAADGMEMSPLSERDTFAGRDHDRRVSDSDDK